MGGSISVTTDSTDNKNFSIIDSKNQEKKDTNDNQISDNFTSNRKALLQLLHQPFFRSSFRKFIIKSWIPSISNEYNNLQLARDTALNCLDFWIDVIDFNIITKSSFQNYRACHIFEKYIMHSASKPIPLNPNFIDECKEKLYGGNEDCDPNIFASSENEAIEFLTIEVYPMFEKASLNNISIKHSNDVIKAIQEGSQRRTRGSLLDSPDKQVLIAIMNKILTDPAYLRIFKLYMIKVGAKSLLYAYYEIIDIRERLYNLAESNTDKEIRLYIFLHYINLFYDTYLCLGAPFRIQLAEATQGDLMRNLSNCQNADHEALRLIEQDSFECFIREHLDPFLDTSEYRLLLRSGRNSVENLVLSLQELPFKEVLVMHEELEDKELKKQEDSKQELINFLSSEYNGYLSRYLKLHGKSSLMHFTQSAYRFQEAHFNNDMERIAQCSSIFERYIARTADDQINLPERMRQTVMRNLLIGLQNIFTDALQWAINEMYDNYWTLFKNEIQTIASIKTTDDNINDGDINNDVNYINDDIFDEDNFDVENEINSKGEKVELSLKKNIIDNSQLVTDLKKSISKSKLRRNSIGAPKIASGDIIQHKIHFKKSGLNSDINFTLQDILSQPKCCSLFKEFLQKESSSQTLIFLVEVEEFRLIPSAAFQISRAKKIYNKFLHALAIMPIPVSEKTRENVEKSISNETTIGVVFKEAIEEVLEYVEKFQLSRFKNSDSIIEVSTILTNEIALKNKSKRSRRTSVPHVCAPISNRNEIESLKYILKYQSCTRFFKDFCNRMFISENLLFWIDAENHSNLPGSDYMKMNAIKICNKYIYENSKLQINIPSSITQEIITGLSNPNRQLFRKAQNEIYNLLEKDALPKFIESPEFSSMIKFVNGGGSDVLVQKKV